LPLVLESQRLDFSGLCDEDGRHWRGSAFSERYARRPPIDGQGLGIPPDTQLLTPGDKPSIGEMLIASELEQVATPRAGKAAHFVSLFGLARYAAERPPPLNSRQLAPPRPPW